MNKNTKPKTPRMPKCPRTVSERHLWAKIILSEEVATQEYDNGFEIKWNAFDKCHACGLINDTEKGAK